jgi:hypothetical protein
MRPSPSSGAKDVVDDGQRAHVAALDDAWLPALRALQALPSSARPQRPARPGQARPQSHSCMFSYLTVLVIYGRRFLYCVLLNLRRSEDFEGPSCGKYWPRAGTPQHAAEAALAEGMAAHEDARHNPLAAPNRQSEGPVAGGLRDLKTTTWTLIRYSTY